LKNSKNKYSDSYLCQSDPFNKSRNGVHQRNMQSLSARYIWKWQWQHYYHYDFTLCSNFDLAGNTSPNKRRNNQLNSLKISVYLYGNGPNNAKHHHHQYQSDSKRCQYWTKYYLICFNYHNKHHLLIHANIMFLLTGKPQLFSKNRSSTHIKNCAFDHNLNFSDNYSLFLSC